MRYPNGRKIMQDGRKIAKKITNFSNRGMSLEEDINLTNAFYLETNVAVIHKKPTPVQIVNVHYPKRSAAVIKEAYFKQPSTTDYNGLYRGKYIDFEAKETNNKTSFPLANIHAHQVKHMRQIINHNGICFFIIRFSPHDETYFLGAEHVVNCWDDMKEGARKSIPYQKIKEIGLLIPFHYQKRVDYLGVIKDFYF